MAKSKGLPSSIVKKYGVSKKAWEVYRGSKTKRKVNKGRGSSKRNRRRTSMPRRRKRRTRRTRTIPILPIVGTIPLFYRAADAAFRGDFGEAKRAFLYDTVGLDENMTFHADKLVQNMIPPVLGIIAHKIASMLGLNRAFSSLPSPLNKLRL